MAALLGLQCLRSQKANFGRRKPRAHNSARTIAICKAQDAKLSTQSSACKVQHAKLSTQSSARKAWHANLHRQSSARKILHAKLSTQSLVHKPQHAKPSTQSLIRKPQHTKPSTQSSARKVRHAKFSTQSSITKYASTGGTDRAGELFQGWIWQTYKFVTKPRGAYLPGEPGERGRNRYS